MFLVKAWGAEFTVQAAGLKFRDVISGWRV